MCLKSVVYGESRGSLPEQEWGFYLETSALPQLEKGFSVHYNTDILIYFKILVPNVFFGMRDVVSFDRGPTVS